MQVLAEVGSPWSGDQGFDSGIRWMAWSASDSVVAVWDHRGHTGCPPIIQVVDAASGKIRKSITLPDEEIQPWERMGGSFKLRGSALSPDGNVLAVAEEDENTASSSLVWLVSLQSGNVILKAVPRWSTTPSLSFSSNGEVVAVRATSEFTHRDMPQLALFQVASGQLIHESCQIASSVYSSHKHTVFILPYFRTVLFGDIQSGSESFVTCHVPAAAKALADDKFLPRHAHVSKGSGKYIQSCATCDSLTLDAGSISPCGSLFVTLGSAGQQIVLEHWHLDIQRSSCDPHLVCTMSIGRSATSLPSARSDPLHPLVEWHPLSAGRLLYAIAVKEGPGLIHVVHGRLHTVLHTVHLADHGISAVHITRLKWSPDGRKLVVLAKGSVYIFQPVDQVALLHRVQSCQSQLIEPPHFFKKCQN